MVEGMTRVLARIPQPAPHWRAEHPHPATNNAPCRLYNIGNNKLVGPGHFIRVLEDRLHMTAEQKMLPRQHGDVPETCADVADLEAGAGFQPKNSIETGIDPFVGRYNSDYQE